MRCWRSRGRLLGLLERQAGRGGSVELVVDRDDIPAVAASRDAATVARYPLRQCTQMLPGGTSPSRSGSSCSGMWTAPVMCPSDHSRRRRTSSMTIPGSDGATASSRSDASRSPARDAPPANRSAGPVAAAAGRSMPIRASSRWASATCSGVSPSSVSAVPRGRSQPRLVAKLPSRLKLSVPGTCAAANSVRERRSTTHSPTSSRRRSSKGSAAAGGERSGMSGPARLAGPM